MGETAEVHTMPRPVPRAWKVLAALAATTAALAGPVPGAMAKGLPAAAPAPSPGPASVAELRAEVARIGDRLAAATVVWEQGQKRLGELVTRKFSTARAADQLAADAQAAQLRASAFAANLYRNPTNPMILAVLSGNARSIGDAAYFRQALGQTQQLQDDDLQLLSEQARRTQELVQQQQDAATAAIALQRELDDELGRLQADAQASLGRLQAAVAEIRRRQAAAAAAALGAPATGDGATCNGPVPVEAINGFLPISALCALSTAPGQRLIAPAAAAFDRMSAAFKATFGTPVCVTDSYRDYAGQVAVFSAKPNLAATPGRSQHGWGRAVDLCGGVQSFGTPAYLWLKANAAAFGYEHPDWAEPGGGRPEPWHWEFRG